LNVVELQAGLGTNIKRGLNSSDVQAHRLEYGDNIIPAAVKKPAWRMFLEHLFNSITFILYAVFIICCINSEFIDAGVVMFLIWGNAILGFYQEYNAEQSMAELQQLSAGTAFVVRDGVSQEIHINEVVVGDLVALKRGDIVPADMRVVSAENLEIDEALLTGESVPVFKNPDPIPEPPVDKTGLQLTVALGDRNNMAFRQTIVCSGTGTGIVVATGKNTKVGMLSKNLQVPDEPTPLQKKLNVFMYVLFAIAIVLAFVIFGITGWEFDKDTAIYASATGIALLPEALIAVITVTLSFAMRRMYEKRAAIRRMHAVEILGNVTDVCSDKTGTLTEGKMVVVRFWPAGSKDVYTVTGAPLTMAAAFGKEESLDLESKNDQMDGRIGRLSSVSNAARVRAPTITRNDRQVITSSVGNVDYNQAKEAARELALVCSMCNNTTLQVDLEENKLVGTGNPTEVALQAFSFQVGASPYYWTDMGYVKCGQWAFDSTVKCMSTGIARDVASVDESGARETRHESLILTKGAPEAVLPKCRDVDIPAVMDKVEHLARQGFRVLACAIGTHLRLDDTNGQRLHDFERSEVEKDLRFVGLVVVYDPPRPESFVAVGSCKTAGIAFRMVTGDHHATAESIARRLGILEDHHGSDRVVTGPYLDALSDEALDAMPELPLVIARCSPDSKVKMINAIHRRGGVAAMTGDGVNDAPAIKKADVGAAMGIAGTDVTKRAADMVLTDDNIATLVNAIEEGRHVAASIRKFIIHLLTTNVAEVIILMIGLVFTDDEGKPVFPMTALEILFVNLFTSTPPAIGLTLEPIDPESMQRPPDRRPMFTIESILDMLIYGLIIGAITFVAYVLVIFGFGNGKLGYGCNNKHTGADTCSNVWRARSTVFLLLNEAFLLHGYVCRDLRKSTFEIPIRQNPWLLASFFLCSILALIPVYVPDIAHTLFKHKMITWEWGIIIISCALYLVLADVWKFAKRRYYGKQRQFYTADGHLEMINVR